MRLNLEYEPEGLVEKVGDFLNVVPRQAEGDLERFKQFIEGRGTATGGWRGAVNEAGTVGSPGVDSASASRGDSGKAGVSGTAVAAGVAAAGVGGGRCRSGRHRREAIRRGRVHPWGTEIGGDVVAVGPGGDTESALRASRNEEPLEPETLGGDPASTTTSPAAGGLGGDPVAVDESGTATARVSGEPSGTTRGLDPLDDPDHPRPPV